VSRKSSSTPSLSEAVEPKLTVASTDQVASAENLTSAPSELVSAVCCRFYIVQWVITMAVYLHTLYEARWPSY